MNKAVGVGEEGARNSYSVFSRLGDLSKLNETQQKSVLATMKGVEDAVDSGDWDKINASTSEMVKTLVTQVGWQQDTAETMAKMMVFEKKAKARRCCLGFCRR